jgi:integrase/recombinase XerD
MSRPSGHATDTEPLEPLEYAQLMPKLPKHWQIFYEIMWQTGARVGEVFHLFKRDIENGGVWITSEKRSDKLREFVPLTPDFYRTLQDLADKRREAHLFPYTPQAAWLALRKAAKDAGVRADTIHPHLFRHAMGHRAYRQTHDIVLVSHMLRHKDLSSTQRYIKPTIAELRDAFRNINKSS